MSFFKEYVKVHIKCNVSRASFKFYEKKSEHFWKAGRVSGKTWVTRLFLWGVWTFLCNLEIFFFALFRSPASLLANLVFATINYLYHFHMYKCFRLKRPKDSKIIVIIFTISTTYTSIILLHAFIPVSISFIFLPEKWENCNIYRVSQEIGVRSSCYRLWKNYFLDTQFMH